MAEPDQKPGRSKQDYGTPPDFMEAVVDRWGKPQIDLAASEKNTKAPEFINQETDSLSCDWTAMIKGLAWLNPPFGDLSPWSAKCRLAARSGLLDGRILLLVPAAVGSNWWSMYVHETAIIHLLRPRICFDEKNPYPRDLALLEYDDVSSLPGKKRNPPDYRLWRWSGKFKTGEPSR